MLSYARILFFFKFGDLNLVRFERLNIYFWPSKHVVKFNIYELPAGGDFYSSVIRETQPNNESQHLINKFNKLLRKALLSCLYECKFIAYSDHDLGAFMNTAVSKTIFVRPHPTKLVS